MSIIINGVNIPNNGDFIKYNGTNIEKVVCNGIEVWKKSVFEPADLSYTGGIQTIRVPAGFYKLEVWGARGGDSINTGNTDAKPGGNGGYSCRYYHFSSATTLYIVCGGIGHEGVANQSLGTVPGGYNGGGAGGSSEGAGGGGATHIALSDGLLYNFDPNRLIMGGGSSTKHNDLLVVAGGGGAGGTSPLYDAPYGGAGGGYNGGTGGGYSGAGGLGGSQTSGGKEGGRFGSGGNAANFFDGGGGGGGYYGGGYGTNYNGAHAGGGGSGYIGVPSIIYKGVTYTNETIAGRNNGVGKAKITLIEQ